MANKLKIQCATCDARKIAQENYTDYEKISIDCAVLFTSPAAKAAMSRLPVALNCASVIELEENVHLRTINGSGEIRSEDTVPGEPFYLQVNGRLTIGPDTQSQMAQCVGMQINGSLICPESIYATLRGVSVNGVVSCYPDNAIVLKRNAVIDHLFVLRAKNRLYWSGKRMILVDPALDAAALRDKGVTLSAREFIIAQSKVEALIDCIDEKADILVVPDGTAVLLDDLVLDRAALRRYGKKLYVIGDVTVPEGAEEALQELEYLSIRGDARVPQQSRDAFLAAVTQITGEVRVARGTLLSDRAVVTVTGQMLEQEPQGIEVRDCGIVTLAPEVTGEQILRRLLVEDCGVVQCSEEQKAALQMVCQGVGEITCDGEEDQDMAETVLDALRPEPDTRVVRAAEYVL